MKLFSKIFIFMLCAGLLAACNTNAQKREKYNRKIYLTEEDYLEDLSDEAVKERRETQPLVESEYIFDVKPETEKTIYFFDDRQQPKVPGEPSEADYKKEKRLWNKPRRYTPEEYYGMQGEAESSEQSSSDPYGYDY